MEKKQVGEGKSIYKRISTKKEEKGKIGPSKLKIEKAVNKKQMFDIECEDYMLDLILKDKSVPGKSLIQNTWLKDVFSEPSIPFKVENNKLVIQIDINLDVFKDYLDKRHHSHFFIAFEAAFIRIIQNKGQNFDVFHKVIIREGRTVMDCFSIFIIWVSRYFKPIQTAFIFQFLIVWLYVLWLKKPDENELKTYFIEHYIKKEDNFEAEESFELFEVLYGSIQARHMDLSELLCYVVEYFLGNDLLQDAY